MAMLRALVLSAVFASAATAQDLPIVEQGRLLRVLRDGYQRFERGASTSPEARENFRRAKLTLERVALGRGELASQGVNADVVRAAIVYSGLGKNPSQLRSLASELFPAEHANEKTRQRALLKAFLLHEVSARRLFSRAALEHGLGIETIVRVERAIVGHSGPAPRGSWWRTAWDATILPLREARLDGPHGDLAREYVGREYPGVASAEGALHAALDRLDQASLESSLQIVAARISQGQPFQKALRAGFSLEGEGNQGMALAQLRTLQLGHPKLFELSLVQEATQSIRRVGALGKRVKVARGQVSVQLPSGERAVAKDLTALYELLARVEREASAEVALLSKGGAR